MEITSRRRVERVRHEPRRRVLAVRNVCRTGNFAAITLAGADLAGFRSDSFDDHVKVFVPGAGGEVLGRDYTPRSFDAARLELTIEFLLHGDGAASQWARAARTGEQIAIGGPRGSMIIPTDYEWHLLAGDASALPAIHRRLEELPAGTRAIVLVQAASEDTRHFTSAAQLDVTWLREPESLLARLRALRLPVGEGYAWCAGEASQMAQVRHILLDEHRHPLEAARIAAYWKRGEAAGGKPPDRLARPPGE